MAKYQVVGPDGSKYQIEGPDDADPTDVIKQVTGAHRSQSYDSLGNGQVAPTGSPAAVAARSPVSPSNFENFVAGYGKTGIDYLRGAGQYLGLESRQDVADSRALDAPLMANAYGRAGNITSNITDALPSMFIPGANTVLGAGAIGAGLGALQPSVSTGETLTNTGLGGGSGSAGILAGRAIGVGYNALKATVQPFFNAGQDAIASRTLQGFAGDTQQAIANIGRNGANVLPGVQPTTAELAQNAGLSQLERQLSINPDTMNLMTNRMTANRQAMQGALSGIAGTPADMEAAIGARDAISKPLYAAAEQAKVTADPALNSLLQRPSMQGAATRAQSLAAERGQPFMPSRRILSQGTRGPASSVQLDPLTLTERADLGLGSLGNSAPLIPNKAMPPGPGKLTNFALDPLTLNPAGPLPFSGKNIQYLKMALADMANSGPQMGMGSHEVGALKGTLGELNNWTQANVPELRAADAAYANASRPINQMEVGQQLSNRLNPALADFGIDVPRTNAESFAKAVRGGDAIAADVTGNKAATLASTMTPQQLQTINQIGQQLARRVNATDLGRSVGSNTAQNLVSQNMLRQVLGPMGLPESWGEGVAKNTLMQSLMRPAQFVAKAGEEKVLTKVANAALDPVEAKRLLQMGIDPSVAKAIWARQGLFGTLGTSSALLGNSAQQ